MEGGHQRRLVDQAGLEGQQAEEKMARRVVSSVHGHVPRRGSGIAWERTDRKNRGPDDAHRVVAGTQRYNVGIETPRFWATSRGAIPPFKSLRADSTFP